MDPNEDTTRPVVALPGVCARVHLPMLPNFLQPVTGGKSIDLGELHRDDLAALGIAYLRELARHWHTRFSKCQRLTEREAEGIGADLLHPAIVERLAMAEAGRDGYAWGGLPQELKTQRIERMHATLHDFAQELTRYG